jgi:phosphatidylglycerophosphate synthase
MSKLTRKNRFIDLSDYGRPLARFIARKLKNTCVTPVHVTLLFGVSGLLAIFSILREYYMLALVFLLLKSILDAADGELARINNQPSYIGRYLDSILDSLLNFAFLAAIGWMAGEGFAWVLLAFVCLQVQGTLYNYYHVVLRHKTSGELTSKVFETKTPVAYPQESQAIVNVLFGVYRLLYKYFDELVYRMDPRALKAKAFPSWFMSLVSLYGLGFQLLLMGIFLALGWIGFIIPFLIGYSILLPVLIIVRRGYIN